MNGRARAAAEPSTQRYLEVPCRGYMAAAAARRWSRRTCLCDRKGERTGHLHMNTPLIQVARGTEPPPPPRCARS